MRMNTKERIMSIRLIGSIKKQPEYSKKVGLSCPANSKREEACKDEKNQKRLPSKNI